MLYERYPMLEVCRSDIEKALEEKKKEVELKQDDLRAKLESLKKITKI